MLTYIIRRLLLMIPTLIGITMVVFFTMASAPGGFKSVLNEGSQGMGDGARRIRQEIVNRYALDQPSYVQYLRWLNRVSPVGFKMSGDIKWSDEQQATLLEEVTRHDWVKTDSEARTARDRVLTIASYSGLEPADVLKKFDEAAMNPLASYGKKDSQQLSPAGPGPELFAMIDAQPLGGRDFWEKQARVYAENPEQAASDLFRELGFSAINKSRVLFNRFKFASPDLGEDKNKRDVGTLLTERLPITLLMNLITLPLIYIVSITAGVLAARKRGGIFDVTSGSVMLGLYSVPVILAGTLMIAYLGSSQYPMLHLFPATGAHDLQADAMPFLPHYKDGVLYRGWLVDFAWHLVLPITCLTYAGFAFLTKVMRSSVLETIFADYVRTARAKGVSESHILFRHVMRNSMLPLITMAASILPGLFVGSFVVEFIFTIQGMGLLTIEAAINKDVNIIMATTLVGSILSLLSLLLRDILYAIADPRVSYD